MNRSPASRIPLFKIKVQEKGVIKDIKEIVVRIKGLPTCLNGQIVDMGGVKGMIMGFDENDVLVLVMGDAGRLRMGREVTGINEPFQVPVGERFIGRMVTAMGEPCDEAGEIEPDRLQPAFRASPSITHLAPVDGFLQTGVKVIDAMVPIAKGQRQLILGDRMTGKTVIALDAILHQAGRGVVCIYCCIGKSVSGLEKVMTVLHDKGALAHTVVMVATDNAPVGEQYLVPFSAVTMGDYFASRGRDVLVVFDDLTKHAWAYRQLSLLLERPPGREAYPGDIFYVQTQLMERAGRYSQARGGGSMTFIGIAETLQGDMTGYIPSNLVSMCDGQVCMSAAVFAEGFRPAVDLSGSLSILGGRVQPAALRELSRNLRAEYAHYAEVVRLSKLQSGLSEQAEQAVRRGESILAVLQQGQHRPVSLGEQVLILYALHRQLLLPLSGPEREAFRKNIHRFVREHRAGLLEEIEAKQELTEDLRRGMDEVLAEYFGAAHG